MQAAKVGHDSLKFPQMEPNGKQPIKMRVLATFFETILMRRCLYKWRINFLQCGLFFDTCL
jgi:hypothetical protein